ncbi:MAG: hypothetical protein ABSE73_29820 [Planctomycetota bacterium]
MPIFPPIILNDLSAGKRKCFGQSPPEIGIRHQHRLDKVAI